MPGGLHPTISGLVPRLATGPRDRLAGPGRARPRLVRCRLDPAPRVEAVPIGCTMTRRPRSRSPAMTTTTGAKPHPIFLAGRWVDSPEPLVVDNPANPDAPAGSTYHATEAQYDEAVEAAVRAFEVTRRLPAYERGAILRNISNGIKARREELGRLMATESGKPIRDALVEVDRATLTFRLGAEEAERMVGEVIPLDLMPASKDRVGITRRFPIGPVAGISPFNFPLNLAAHKVSPAIAAGCSIVLKPPSKDPLTMLAVAEIIE